MPFGDKTIECLDSYRKKTNSRIKVQKQALGGKMYFNVTLKIKLLGRTCNKLTKHFFRLKQIVFLWNTFYVLSSLDRNTHSCAQKFKFKCRWIFKMSDDTATSFSCWVKFFKFLQCVNTQKRKRTQNLSFFFSFHCISLS